MIEVFKNTCVDESGIDSGGDDSDDGGGSSSDNKKCFILITKVFCWWQ